MGSNELVKVLVFDAMRVARWAFFGGYATGFVMGACIAWFLS